MPLVYSVDRRSAVNYELIIKRSFQIAWKYKLLWIFGLFAAGQGQINFSAGSDSESPFGTRVDFDVMIEQFTAFLIPFLVLFITAVVATIIAMPALVDGVQRIARGGTFKMMDSLSVGIDQFWHTLGFYMLFALFVFCGIMLAVVPAIASLWTLVFTIPALILGTFLLGVWFSIGFQVLCVRRTTIGASLSEAWQLILAHKRHVAVMFLIIFGLLLGFSLIAGTGLLLIYLPANLIIRGLIDSFFWQTITGIIVSLPFALVVGGFYGTFIYGMYTLFYLELVEPGILDKFDPTGANDINPPMQPMADNA